MSELHRTSAWVKLRTQLVAQARRADLPCGICGMGIDWSVSGRHPWGPTLDHILPVALRPDLALDPSNLRVAHAMCNRAPKMTQVAALAGHAVKGAETPAEAPSPADPTNHPAPAWALPYATLMASQGSDYRTALAASRPWCADWTIEDYDRGLVTADGRRH